MIFSLKNQIEQKFVSVLSAERQNLKFASVSRTKCRLNVNLIQELRSYTLEIRKNSSEFYRTNTMSRNLFLLSVSHQNSLHNT